MRGRGAKGGRGRGAERLNTLFLDAVLPAGPCSLTPWLEEGGLKTWDRGLEGEKG